MSPADGVLGEGSVGLHHFMEGSDSVAFLELVYIRSNGVDDAGNIITSVQGLLEEYWNFPVES